MDEIKKQIELGRYNRYAILDNEVNVGVFADYLKYRKLLKGKNTRKYVPPFNLRESLDMVIPEEASRYFGIYHMEDGQPYSR